MPPGDTFICFLRARSPDLVIVARRLIRTVVAPELCALVRHYDVSLAAFSLPIGRWLIERPMSALPDLRVVSDHAWSNTTQSN